MPATSPPAIAPATSTAPIETHQRIAALPSSDAMVTRKLRGEKREHRWSLHIQVNRSALISPRLPTPAERGGYLVNTIMACGNCHTPHDADGKTIAEQAFSSGLA